ncbi:hypothetical protein [Mollivirus kamchatka]|nr:hypothetical protein [Mollivirus kamchatka]
MSHNRSSFDFDSRSGFVSSIMDPVVPQEQQLEALDVFVRMAFQRVEARLDSIEARIARMERPQPVIHERVGCYEPPGVPMMGQR